MWEPVDVRASGMDKEVDGYGSRCDCDCDCDCDCEHGGRYDLVRLRTPISFKENRQKTFDAQGKVFLVQRLAVARTRKTATDSSALKERTRQSMMVQNSTEDHNPAVILMPIFLAKPECVTEFEEAMLVLQAASRADEGCVDYTAYADREDRCRFVLYEKWTSSAALKSHNEQPHVRDFVAVVGDLLVQPFQVARLRSIG